MTREQTEELLNCFDTTTLLELHGNYYEYIGRGHGKHLFQNMSDDSFIEASDENLLTMTEYNIYHITNHGGEKI